MKFPQDIDFVADAATAAATVASLTRCTVLKFACLLSLLWFFRLFAGSLLVWLASQHLQTSSRTNYRKTSQVSRATMNSAMSEQHGSPRTLSAPFEPVPLVHATVCLVRCCARAESACKHFTLRRRIGSSSSIIMIIITIRSGLVSLTLFALARYVAAQSRQGLWSHITHKVVSLFRSLFSSRVARH